MFEITLYLKVVPYGNRSINLHCILIDWFLGDTMFYRKKFFEQSLICIGLWKLDSENLLLGCAKSGQLWFLDTKQLVFTISASASVTKSFLMIE